MDLIVAEKPSLARNIAAAVGGGVKRNGYLECRDYLITWAFGHLFSLVDIEDYQGGEVNKSSGKVRWTLDNLPCIPSEFRYELRRGDDKKVDSGVRSQFDTITYLVNRPDVAAIINAGDADREGEIIVRTCVSKALKSPKPMKRLWLPDQTPETVRAALASLDDDSKYDDLANEGYARTYIDWLYGTNLTRYATVKTGKFLRLCRTISYASTPMATDALSESTSPFIGMDAVISQVSLTRRLTPLPSLPITRPMGPAMLTRYITSPSISAQTNQIPLFLRSSMVRTRLVTFATGV